MVLAIYGAGFLGKETLVIVEDILKEQKCWEEVVYIDDTKPIGEYCGHMRYPFDEFMSRYDQQAAKIHIAVGEPFNKDKLARKVRNSGYSLENIIHPSVRLAPSAVLADGVQIKMGSYIGENVKIGAGACLQAYVTIGDNTTIGACSQISAKASIGSDVSIGDNVFVGMCSVVVDGVTIGHDSVVSMGAVVLKDVDQGRVCAGNPGRVIGVNNSQLLFNKH